MIRFDASSGLVLALAVSSSLSAAWWLNHLDGRGRAEAAPVAVSVAHGTDAQVVRGSDGHYWAQADIDGRAVRVMVDTGASVVVLTPDDATRLGVRLKESDFHAVVQTASGPVGAAPVTLDHVAIAGARVDHVQALVVKEGLPHSLLGMSYLGRLSRFEATPAGLTLRP